MSSPVNSSPPCPICSAPGGPAARFAPAPLWRCAACDFVFLDGEDAADLYGDDYFQEYVGGDYLVQEGQRRHESRVRLILLECLTPPPARLLEVGAAAGFFLDEARARGYEGLGIEPNPAMASHARKRLGLDVRTGRLGGVELQPGSFDAVCAFHVVEHLSDPVGALRQIREAVRPGGNILVEVPNAQSAAARRRGVRWRPLDLPHHVGHHSPDSLRSSMERAGLETILIDTVPFAFYSSASRSVAWMHGAMEGARSGAPPFTKPHPTEHQLLRCMACRPAA